MFANFGYNKMVCYDCKEVFTPRFCKLWDFLSNDSGLAGVGRFQVVHNGHKIEMVNTDDPSVDWDAISDFREVPDFELSGNVRQILSEVYP